MTEAECVAATPLSTSQTVGAATVHGGSLHQAYMPASTLKEYSLVWFAA